MKFRFLKYKIYIILRHIYILIKRAAGFEFFSFRSILIILFKFFYFLKDREVNLIWRLLSVLKRICCLHCIFIFVNIITSTFNLRVYIFVKNKNEAKVGVDLTYAMRIKFLICVRFLYCNCTVLKRTSTVHTSYCSGSRILDPGIRHWIWIQNIITNQQPLSSQNIDLFQSLPIYCIIYLFRVGIETTPSFFSAHDSHHTPRSRSNERTNFGGRASGAAKAEIW